MTLMSAADHSTERPPETPQYRPAHHFTPSRAWMNDPNGLVFHDGIWHLFFQHYPHAQTWGPMHWGHATSLDLMHWQEQPIALAPDPLGMIFSGSVVIDTHNSSELGTPESPAWVAIFTHHDAEAEKAGRCDFQHQSLAYSLDEGSTWHKYAGNPVLPNPGQKNLRDPKVFWHEASARWVMSLAAGDHIAFYTSPDLKAWTKQSDFGQDQGAHGGVWECPDLIPLTLDDQQHWVLLVSLVPGGPNEGSATQYFVGNFDGQHFTPLDDQTRWLDHGPDNYAGVTWHNTAPRTVFIGWMSNWTYAKDLPTAPWRSAMTLPRELSLRAVRGTIHLSTHPTQEVFERLSANPTQTISLAPAEGVLNHALHPTNGCCALAINAPTLHDFTLTLSNDVGDALHIGFDAASTSYWIDRTQAGLSGFSPDFARRHTAPRLSRAQPAQLTLLFDRTSVELFADDGLTSMTSLHFPRQPWSRLSIEASDAMCEGSLQIRHFL